MTLAPGDRFPDIELVRMADGRPRPVSSGELLARRRVVLVAVPGAFTPTCSDVHLPGFASLAEEIRKHDVDEIACVAVNDVFVLDAWRRAQGLGGEILMLADGNGELTRALGLELDARTFGMGRRSRRWAAVVEDGVLRWLAVEPAGGVVESSAQRVLSFLTGDG